VFSDPDLGGLKRAKRKEKTQPKRQLIRQKNTRKSNVIDVKICKCDFIFIIEINASIVLENVWILQYYLNPDSAPHGSAFIFKAGSRSGSAFTIKAVSGSALKSMRIRNPETFADVVILNNI
jgi:hypothetical protein